MGKDTYTSKRLNSLFENIFADYMSQDEEFTSEFCDYEVSATKGELLKLYEHLMLKINGDYIVYVPEAKVTVENEENHLYGTLRSIDDYPKKNEKFKGNFKSFLESFNDNNEGFYRMYDYASIEQNGGETIQGIAADDFVW